MNRRKEPQRASPPIYPEGYEGDYIRLDELAKLIPIWQKKYGKTATLVHDAGYNSVSAEIHPTKKQKG